MGSKTIKNMLFLGGASAANVVMTALQSLMLGRILNVEMFGITRTITAYMILLTMLGHFTLHNALSAAIVKTTKKDEITTYVLHAALLVLGISIVVSITAILVISSSNFWPLTLHTPLIIIISSLPVVCLTIVFNGCLEALGAYSTYVRVIFLAGLIPLLILIPFAWIWGLNGWLTGRILSAVLLLLIAIFAIREYIQRVLFNSRYVKELFAFARIQIFSGLLSLALLSIDVILLEALTHDLTAVANYGAALLFYNACAIVPTSMGRVYFKQVALAAAHAREKQKEYLLFTFAVGLIGSLLLYSLGPYILSIFFNSNYQSAISILRIMSLGLTSNFLWSALSTINIATSQPKSATIISATGALVGITSLSILIPRYHAEGAAFSMVLAYTAGTVIGLWLLQRRISFAGAINAV